MMTLNFIQVYGQKFFLDFNEVERVGGDIRLAPGVWVGGDHPVKRPNFRSNAGHQGWCRTLMEEIGLTYAQADVALRCRNDIAWVLEAPEEALESISQLGVFSPYCLKDDNKDYIPFYRDMSFKDWSRNKEYFDTGLVKSVGKVRFLHAIGITPEMLARVGPTWKSLSKERLLAKATGVPTLVAQKAAELVDKESKPGELLADVAPVASKINPAYWECTNCVSDLLTAGVQAVDLLPFMTRKEANRCLSSEKRPDHVGRWFFTPQTWSLKWLMEERHGVGRVPFWVHDYSKSVMVAEWAMRHLGQLSNLNNS